MTQQIDSQIISQIKEAAGEKVRVQNNLMIENGDTMHVSFNCASADTLISVWRESIKPLLVSLELPNVEQIKHSVTRKVMWRVGNSDVFRMAIKFKVR